jgi:predicted Zn-dependent peptidase
VLAQLLAGGDASLFYQGLVKGREIALNVNTMFGLVGPFEYDGPTLLTVFALYKPGSSADAMLAAMDEEIGKVAKGGVDDATLKRVKTRMLASWYNQMEAFINRADTLAKLQTIWGDANVANKIPGWIEGVTSDDIKRVAGTYLVASNRTVIDRKPVAKAAPVAAERANPPAGEHK